MEPRMTTRRGGGALSGQCIKCNQVKSSDEFLTVKPWHFKDGKYPVCNTCLIEHYASLDWDWDALDKFAQGIDIPFVPSEFERLRDINGDNGLIVYARMFGELKYTELEWKMYHDKYMELKRRGKLDLELPNIRETYFEDLKLRWGADYDDETLMYLETLYNGILASQNINGDLQHDQARKMCKLSWVIDERIRAGDDFDKLMSSYDKLAKIANFTPKNIKSGSNLSSMGEVVVWLEKRGWLNPHYSDARQDIIDEVIKSTQTFAQRLYTNETGLGEEIEERIQQLKIAAELGEQDEKLGNVLMEEEDDFFNLSTTAEELEDHEDETYRELIVDDVLDSDSTSV